MSGFTYDGVHSDAFFIVNSTSRDVLPQVNNRLLSAPGRPGAYSFGIDVGIRRFTMDVTLIYSNIEEFRTKVREIAGWLYSEKPKPLVFDDEPGMTYYALLSDDSTLDQMGSAGFGKLTFICPDPYAYGETKTVRITSTPVTVEGTAGTFPIFTFTFSAAASYAQVSDGANYVRVNRSFKEGDILVIDNEKSVVTVNDVRVMNNVPPESEFFHVPKGTGRYTVTPSGVATVDMTFTERWR